ncbi:hypothetical protein OG233_11150 [Streptomyces sp. NBC_01218]|uniref:hypothetical protein n=1 Tax=unclassified Streptomyces TaxID=2593676 RepID=UPI0023B9B3AD|nr:MULTISPECIES: hypothetical protein [unclassified Streptomyces]WEH40000.1 hypothetical protein PZB77_10995 [Streptomyces sp. AM 2-1-1]WSQ51691.1 hypothetical protein OG233_11150 [Streptomyces sp. NBC_01218]
MKLSSARILGVAALGAAFAAAAAGSASAASALPLDAGSALPVSTDGLSNLGHAAQTLPVKETTGSLLGGKATDAAAPVTQLLGGLPTKGLDLNGIPLGG